MTSIWNTENMSWASPFIFTNPLKPFVKMMMNLVDGRDIFSVFQIGILLTKNKKIKHHYLKKSIYSIAKSLLKKHHNHTTRP